MERVAILGSGQIGRAVYKIVSDMSYQTFGVYDDVEAFVIDSNKDNIAKLVYGSHYVLDLENSQPGKLAALLEQQRVTHVINALPFFLNEKVAAESAKAGCAYIDFTEDDRMADAVQSIYKDTGLDCAVKCGLAPGFINYIGHSLVESVQNPQSLMISVGALPKTVSYDANRPELSYNISWSVDGLVNEYIRPCRVRQNGNEVEVEALTGYQSVVLDGTLYEAAYTSGGVGSLVKDLSNVPNVSYKTLRYPGHYDYVGKLIAEHGANFEPLKKVFQEKFPITDDDVIVVYAEAIGYNNGSLVRKSFYNKYYGTDGMTGIQSTTAGAGVAVLELMMTGKIKGVVNHKDIGLSDFTNTHAYESCYKTKI